MILKAELTLADVQNRIDMTRYLLEALGVKLSEDSAKLEDVWLQFWHVTRVMEWPWALEWFTKGAKVFDVGSDPLFSLLLLRAGVTDVTLHHTSVDVQNLGKAPLHTVGWCSLHNVWKANDDKLKMVYGYPDQLDLAPEIYDIVFNISVMEHVEEENWFDWMDATWRLLKPGGILVMTCDYLLKVPVSGPVIDIINHPFSQFFDSVDGEIITPTVHIPWHVDFDSVLFEEAFEMQHPANQDGTYTVYGFVVRKGK